MFRRRQPQRFYRLGPQLNIEKFGRACSNRCTDSSSRKSAASDVNGYRSIRRRELLSGVTLTGILHNRQVSAKDDSKDMRTIGPQRELTFLYFDSKDVSEVDGEAGRALPPRKLSNQRECDVAITHMRDDRGNEIFLIGTAHISNSSAALANRVIENVAPDLVMVELDSKRIGAGTGSKADNRDDPAEQKVTFGQRLRNFFNEISHPKELVLGAVIGKLISKMYQGMGEEGFTVGGEFIAAFKYAQKYKVPVLLGDRPIDITFKRLAQAASTTDIEALISPDDDELKELGFSPEEDTSAQELSIQIEQLKNREMVGKLQSYMKKKSPKLYQTLIGERDLYMAGSLSGAVDRNFKRIVGVVGFAHLDGIEAALTKSEVGFKRVDMCTG